MGVVISSVVAGGPAVLEDLETPYAVIQDRKIKQQQEKQKQKPRLRRQRNQLQFEPNSARLNKSQEEKKNKSNTNFRSSSRNSSGPSRPQSRNSKVTLKRQNSLDVSSPSPRQSQSNNDQGQTSVTDKIRMMLSTPKPSKKIDSSEVSVEKDSVGMSNAVKDTIDTMFQQINKSVNIEEDTQSEKHPQIPEVENEDQTSISDSSKTEAGRPARREKVKRISSKQKLEMFKNLPSARKDEYKTYTAQPNISTKLKKSNSKLVNVKENKKDES